jgi:hypothetical protein
MRRVNIWDLILLMVLMICCLPLVAMALFPAALRKTQAVVETLRWSVKQAEPEMLKDLLEKLKAAADKRKPKPKLVDGMVKKEPING